MNLIFHPIGMEITDRTLARAEDLNVAAIWTPVMALDDVITTKLNALNEHFLNYESLLGIARSLREQIDWDQVRSRTTRDRPSRGRSSYCWRSSTSSRLTNRAGAPALRIKVMPAPAADAAG